MMTKFLKYSCSLVLILSCAGCLKKPVLLKPLTKESAHDSQTKEQVTVHTKRLSFEDQENMFGHETYQLVKHRIVPIQITVENKSENIWLLTNKNISLRLLSIDEVNKILFTEKRLLPLGLFLDGLIQGLLTEYILLILGGTGCRSLLFLYGGTIAGVFIIVSTGIAVTCGIVNHISKKHMHEYLKTYCKMEGITINPDIKASMLFFVEESQLPKKLNLLLVDKNTGKNTIPFELNL